MGERVVDCWKNVMVVVSGDGCVESSCAELCMILRTRITSMSDCVGCYMMMLLTVFWWIIIVPDRR